MSYPTFGKRRSASATGMERRRSDRRRISIDGKIHIDGRKFLKCSIVDLSNTGALLMLDFIQGIPDTFKLEDHVGRRRTARVTRRKKSSVGVKFD
jgi:hypothetical protein